MTIQAVNPNSKPLFGPNKPQFEERIFDTDGSLLRAACVCVKDSSEQEVFSEFQKVPKSRKLILNDNAY